jgi:hypothetical protein
MDSTYQSTQHSKKRITQILGSLLFIAIIVGTGVIIILGTRKGPEDTQSRASESANPSFSAVNTKAEANLQQFDVLLDMGTQASQLTVTSFETELVISPQDQQVLGITTPPNKKNEMTADEKARRLRYYGKPTTTTVPVALVIPCYNLAIDGATPSWPNSCRGIPGRTICQGGAVALNADEKARYEIWKKHGKPQVPGCGANATPLPTTSARAQQNTTPAQVVSSPNSTPAPVATPFFTENQISVSSELGNIILFDKPVVSYDESTGIYRVKISGKITERTRDAQQSIAATKRLVTISLKDIKTSVPLSVTVVNQRVRGFSALSPNAELELTAKPQTP